MNKFVFIPLLSFFMGGVSVSAQEFHGATLYDAVGPVEEIQIDTKNPFVYFSTAKFTPNGKANGAYLTYTLSYDADGYPSGFDMKNGNSYAFMKIVYDKANRPDSIVIDSNLMEAYLNVTVANSYDSKGILVGRTIAKTLNDNKRSYRFSYSNIVNDDHGNWVSRSVVQEETGGAQPSKKEYVEKRTIKYYTGGK